MLDEKTDYQYDISEWLEDCLDEIDMREEYEVLLGMCDTFAEFVFSWPDYTGSDLKFRKSSVLRLLEEIMKQYPSAVNGLKRNRRILWQRQLMSMHCSREKNMKQQKKLIHQFVIDESECLEENEIMFRAASKYYGAIGDKTKKKQLDKVLKEYETYVDRMIEEEWLGSDEDGWEDEELPFD